MNKKLKSQIKSAFDAPAPARKTEFLKSINFPKASRWDFILGQIGYIRKRVWITSCLLVIAALAGLHFFANNNSLSLIWIVSSLLPFIVLVALTEIARSTSYNMAELEMGCRYSFSDIVLVRIGILSCFNMAIFGLLIISFLYKVDFGFFRLGMYFFVPFLLTSSLSLLVLNHLHSRETMYICGGISCFVGIANTIVTMEYNKIFAEEYLFSWNIVFIILLLGTVRESFKFIKMEVLQWNLS